MSTLLKTLLATPTKNRPCAEVCDSGLPGSVELVLLRQLLGLCLRLSLTLSADCPSRKSG
ncbi:MULTISPECIES: hypothetical protein [unclassified Streptomyces]|uniref:hypothetical protein n=1 Tax=unclassified Streptomyces TaxID=2593676 RepID=UPI0006F3EBD8|nr:MULTISPECIES: hypothetical protein [unclassified Streptomyces]KQX59396.1 hypothetical protein ASD33_03705 [Streptomyces sp. Root1304]KRB00657.1 hypothetical protein ASE09_03705 [Streptomyces sp. Root66D1]